MSDPLHESLLVRQQYMGLLGFWGWQDCQAAPGTWVSGSSVQRNRCNNFLLRQFFKILTMPSVFSWKGTPKWVVKWPNLEVAVQRYKFRKIFRSAKLEKTFLNFFVPASPFYFFRPDVLQIRCKCGAFLQVNEEEGKWDRLLVPMALTIAISPTPHVFLLAAFFTNPPAASISLLYTVTQSRVLKTSWLLHVLVSRVH